MRLRLLYPDGGLAQSVECVVSNDEAPGSKPGFSIFAEHPCEASIAQMVERKTLNLVVVGSIPTGGALLDLPSMDRNRRLPSVRLAIPSQQAALAQLGERQTEDLKVPGSIPGGGTFC